jgi:hypothetical protein
MGILLHEVLGLAAVRAAADTTAARRGAARNFLNRS